MKIQDIQKAESLFAELRELQHFNNICDNYDAVFTLKVSSKHNHNTRVPVSTDVAVPGDIVNKMKDRVIARIAEIKSEIQELSTTRLLNNRA